MKSLPSIWYYVVSVKSTVKISSIFVAFLENMNFTLHSLLVSIGTNNWNITTYRNKLENFNVQELLHEIF